MKPSKLLTWGIVGVLGYVVISNLSKKGDNAKTTLVLYDSAGNVIAGSNAGVFSAGGLGAMVTSAVEGDTISAVLTVTNTSYKVLGGVNTLIPAKFAILFQADLLTPPDTFHSRLVDINTILDFAAGETKAISETTLPGLSWALPGDSGGLIGKAAVSVYVGPLGTVTPTARAGGVTATFPIVTAAATWGGTITF